MSRFQSGEASASAAAKLSSAVAETARTPRVLVSRRADITSHLAGRGSYYGRALRLLRTVPSLVLAPLDSVSAAVASSRTHRASAPCPSDNACPWASAPPPPPGFPSRCPARPTWRFPGRGFSTEPPSLADTLPEGTQVADAEIRSRLQSARHRDGARSRSRPASTWLAAKTGCRDHSGTSLRDAGLRQLPKSVPRLSKAAYRHATHTDRSQSLQTPELPEVCSGQ